VGQREWRQLRAVQDLVGVGVADASEDLLVGEHALDLSAPEADPLSEGGRVDGEGVRPQPRHARDDGWVTDQVDGEALLRALFGQVEPATGVKSHPQGDGTLAWLERGR